VRTGLVEGAVSEHGVEGVAAAAGEGDEGLVVSFAFGPFPVVIGPRQGILQRGERGEEQGSFEDLVSSAMGGHREWMTRIARSPGQALVGSQLSYGGEVFADDPGEDPCCGSDADRREYVRTE
jgi:hypothetical protein